MHPPRVLGLLAIAFALLLRAAVPSGWMPAAGTDGGLLLVPCPAAAPVLTAHGAAHHASGDHHGGGKPEHDGKKGGDCAFAPLQLGFDLASTPGLPPPSSPLLAPPSPWLASPAFARGPPAPPPPSTGPPRFA